MQSQLIKQGVTIQYVDALRLRPAEYNPRKWDESAAKKLAESIKRFGLVDPIIVNSSPNRKNVVIGGHFRLQVAKRLGITQVPIVYVNIPKLQREKELNLRLNRNTGEWDFELLKDFDVELLLDVGFDDSDLSHIWDDTLGVEDDEFDTEKELEKIKESKSKLGDTYELGIHRLVCGDATDPEIVKKVVGEDKVSTLYCDPPYNIALDYNNGIGANGKYGGKTNDRKSEEEYKVFLKKTLENGLSAIQPNAHIFYWCDENYIGLIQQIYKELGITSK